jgi:hypothetical protein
MIGEKALSQMLVPWLFFVNPSVLLLAAAGSNVDTLLKNKLLRNTPLGSPRAEAGGECGRITRMRFQNNAISKHSRFSRPNATIGAFPALAAIGPAIAGFAPATPLDL